MSENDQFTPGIPVEELDLHTDRELLRAQVENAIRYMKAKIKHEQDLPHSDFHRHAMKNLVTVLMLQFSDISEDCDLIEALQCSKSVISEDPGNLNAWKNQQEVNARLRESVRGCEQKLDELLQGEDGKLLRRCRCLAEQAFALSFEFGFERYNQCGDGDTARYERANDLYRQAIRIDKEHDVFSDAERTQWHYFQAKSNHALHKQLYDLNQAEPKQVSIFDKGVRALWNIVTCDYPGDSFYKGKAWALLGTFFWKHSNLLQSKFHHDVPISESIEECKFASHFDNPEKCFDEALKCSPGDPSILVRKARMILFLQGQTHDDGDSSGFDTGVSLLTESIEGDSSACNWFAFSSRGLAYKKLYNFQQRQHAKARRERRMRGLGKPDRSLLEKAKEDLEKSLKLNLNFRDKIKLGEVCHMLGNGTYGNDYDPELLAQAAKHFLYVVERRGRQRDPFVYMKLGDLYHYRRDSHDRNSEYHQKAMDYYKIAIEHEVSSARPMGFGKLIYLLMNTYKDKFKNVPNYSELDEACELMSSMGFWFHLAHSKYDSIDFTTRKSWEIFPTQMLEVCHVLKAKGHLETAVFCLSAFTKVCESQPKRDHEFEKKIEELLKKVIAEKTQSVSHPTSPKEKCETDHCDQGSKFQRGDGGSRCSIRMKHSEDKSASVSGRKYDFLILHSNLSREQSQDSNTEDRGWAGHYLLSLLENHSLRGCFVDRDIDHGNELMDSIEDCLKNSACVIVVMTPRFLKDKFCMRILREIQATDDTQGRVILVLRDYDYEITLPASLKGLPAISGSNPDKLVAEIEDLCAQPNAVKSQG